MKRSAFPTEGVWLTGNLHTHSTLSDGSWTPEEMAAHYRANGYDFLCCSDHHLFAAHDEAFASQGIISLNGAERTYFYNAEKKTDLLAIAAGTDCGAYENRPYESADLPLQTLIDRMHDEGQLVIIPHPYGYRITADDIFPLKHIFGVEVYNGDSSLCGLMGDSTHIWDELLRRGKRVFATGGDDAHSKACACRCRTVVKAKERSRAAILDALRVGDFYVSTGPEITDFGVEDGEVYVTCSPCRAIHFRPYPCRTRTRGDRAGSGLLSEARLPLTGEEQYVYAICEDDRGRLAWTQPIRFENS